MGYEFSREREIRNSRGTGLNFSGYPTDVKRFKWILAEEGCHPKAADRILERLSKNGYDLLTVQNDLNFIWIKDELEKIGVIMTRIKPLKNWELKYDNGIWPNEALPERFRK
jgi:hypothetical protein